MSAVLDARRAGVLLHPTSLPGTGRCGVLGPDAYRFVDWLASAGFSVWQTLPLGPTDEYGSPYCARSAYAGNRALLAAETLASLPELPASLRFDGTTAERYASFAAGASLTQRRGFAHYLRRRRAWLLPYGLFELCSARFPGAPWWSWPTPFRDRDRVALHELHAREREQFRALAFEQYLFELTWAALRRYAHARGVYLFGDLPFYVDRNSVEVWWERGLFELDSRGEPTAVAGVPPDYFNADGQLWGNPLYDWEAHERTGFRWWLARLKAQLERFDLLRIDHFRALESFWEVPAAAATAKAGRWRPGRGAELLSAVRAALGELPIVAEDLGIITDEVRALRDRFALPGMVVLQFAFDGSPANPHLPQHHRTNAVVYTGTHDNDTTVGWYRGLDANARGVVHRMLGVGDAPAVPDFLVAAAYESAATLAVVPMQDLLSLDAASRMNAPGTVSGNWQWRFQWDQVPATLAAACRARAQRTARLPQTGPR